MDRMGSGKAITQIINAYMINVIINLVAKGNLKQYETEKIFFQEKYQSMLDRINSLRDKFSREGKLMIKKR